MIARVIKFRYFDIDQKKFIYSDSLDLETQLFRLAQFFKRAARNNYNVQLQQFTGLQDKNGCDIFEGDIINGYLCIDEIGSGGYTNSNEWDFTDKVTFAGCGFYCEKADFPIDQYETLEIIGNIYDNPELLK